MAALEPFLERKAAAAELLAAEPLPLRALVGGIHAVAHDRGVYELMLLRATCL